MVYGIVSKFKPVPVHRQSRNESLITLFAVKPWRYQITYRSCTSKKLRKYLCTSKGERSYSPLLCIHRYVDIQRDILLTLSSHTLVHVRCLRTVTSYAYCQHKCMDECDAECFSFITYKCTYSGVL
jgi:hypothetical protein